MTGTHTSSSYLHGGSYQQRTGVRENADEKKEGCQAQAKKPPDGEIRLDGVGVRRWSGQSALHRKDDIRPRLPAAKVHPPGLIRSRAAVGCEKPQEERPLYFCRVELPKGEPLSWTLTHHFPLFPPHHCHQGRVRLSSAVVVVVAARQVMSGVHLDRGGRCRRRAQ